MKILSATCDASCVFASPVYTLCVFRLCGYLCVIVLMLVLMVEVSFVFLSQIVGDFILHSTVSTDIAYGN